MDSARRALIQALHDAPPMAALVLTGGGTGAAAQLLAVPGASRTVLEVAVPYDEHALCEYLGRRPAQFCAADTAAAMAERALDRARHLPPGRPVVGLACTASLVTDRPKRGEHRFFVAAATETATTIASATLRKGARDREAEEDVVDDVILNLLAETFGIADRLPLSLQEGEPLQVERRARGSLLVAVIEGKQDCVCQEPDGRLRADGPRPALVLPGAFNPLHEGHRLLARTAAKLSGLETAFELSLVNVDKPPLGIEELRRRMAQFHWLAPLWLTRAALFTEKARLFPGATFAIGLDTAARLLEPRYYGNDPARMQADLEEIRAQRCRFLVAGRQDSAGAFRQLEDLVISDVLRDLFRPVPASEFQSSISSTELRAKGESHSEG